MCREYSPLPAQVSGGEPVQEVDPVTFYRDGLYVNGDLWSYWKLAFEDPRVDDMYADVLGDIDNPDNCFTHAVAWYGPPPTIM